MNPDLSALHFWDNVGVEPLSLPEASRGEEVRAFLSDHHFSDTSSINEFCYVSMWFFLSMYEHFRSVCLRCQQCVTGQGQPTLEIPAKTERTFCCNTTCNLFVRVLLSVCFCGCVCACVS